MMLWDPRQPQTSNSGARISLNGRWSAADSKASGLWVWFGRRDVHERVIEAAAAAPVGGRLRGEQVDGASRAARVDEPAERHPGDAGPDAVGQRADGAQLAALVPHADRVAAGQPS